MQVMTRYTFRDIACAMNELRRNHHRSKSPHPKTATEKHLDIERGDGFQCDAGIPNPMVAPYVGCRFPISEQGDVLYPHHRPTKINANWEKHRNHSQGLQALQRRQEDKACHKKIHPYRVALVKRQVVRKLCAQNTLKE
jgi:hypothetical protein